MHQAEVTAAVMADIKAVDFSRRWALMKKRIEGLELLDCVPDCRATGISPVVKLEHGLVLDEGNCWSSPTLLLGAVGSGKTTLMQRMMDPILDHANRLGDNVVIFCAKPDMLRYARPQDFVIHINSSDPKCCWSIFSEINASDNPEMTLREISTALFEEARAKTNQVFFPDAARDVFFHTCRYLYDYGVRTGTMPDNADLVEFLETTPVWGNDEIPGWTNLAELQPSYFSMVRDYIGDGTQQGLGVLSELRTLISNALFGNFAARGGQFSAIETLKKQGQRIFLYYDYAAAGHSTLTVLHILLDLLMKQSMNHKNRNKTWFFLDEASVLPKSEVLTDLLSLARDPGSNGKGGARIVMALQSARLMTHHYTETEAECLLSLFPNVFALRVSDSMSRKFLADRYGKALYQYSYGVGNTIHYADCVCEDVVADHRFAELTKKGQAIVSLATVRNPFFYDGYTER